MYLLVILAPLTSTIFIFSLSRWLTKYDILTFHVYSFVVALATNVLIFYEVIYNKSYCIIDTGSWIACSKIHINWSFLFDFNSTIMLTVILSISACVHIYSFDYMSEDPHLLRFMGLLGFFTVFMLLFVLANNFVIMFFGWEGVGLVSYLLIGFWFNRLQAVKSALKALVVNRISDCCLYLSLLLLFASFEDLEYTLILSLSQFSIFETTVLYWAVLLLIIGAIGKSAQLGLHTWLPDAMEGPTPVSALLHAATMVTAGVFLLIRCSLLLQAWPALLAFIVIIGTLTSIFAGSIACFQNDLKKIIAYSTCSQLGYMFVSCGISAYNLALFHLFNHAFFKALLFLGAGSVIHALQGEQDLRKMGALVTLLPITWVSMCIGSIALIGLPFLAGFYSKDLVFEVLWWNFSISGIFVYWLAWLSIVWTTIYSCRLLFLGFLTVNNSRVIISKIVEPSITTIIVLLFLCICSILTGFLMKGVFSLLLPSATSASFASMGDHFFVETESIDYFNFIFFPLLAIFIGVILSVFLLVKWKNLLTKTRFKRYYNWTNQKWFVDVWYNEFIVYPLAQYVYGWVFKLIDRGILEQFGSLQISAFCQFYSRKLMNVSNGQLLFYLFFAILNICFSFLIIYIFSL